MKQNTLPKTLSTCSLLGIDSVDVVTSASCIETYFVCNFSVAVRIGFLMKVFYFCIFLELLNYMIHKNAYLAALHCVNVYISTVVLPICLIFPFIGICLLIALSFQCYHLVCSLTYLWLLQLIMIKFRFLLTVAPCVKTKTNLNSLVH